MARPQQCASGGAPAVADGFYLSRIGGNGRKALVVRIIEYHLKDVPGGRQCIGCSPTMLDGKVANQRTGGPVSRPLGNRRVQKRTHNPVGERPTEAKDPSLVAGEMP